MSDSNTNNTPADADNSQKLAWTGGRYSGKAFRFQFVGLILLTLAFYLLAMKYGTSCYNWLGHWWFWGIVQFIPLVLWIRCLWSYFYNTTTISYKLENNLFLSTSGLFKQREDSLRIPDINDIHKQQNIFDRLFLGGIGDVVLHSSDASHPYFVIARIEDVDNAFLTIAKLISEYDDTHGIKSYGSGAAARPNDARK